MKTDTEFLLDYLRAHPEGRDCNQIWAAAHNARGVGMTVHSRINDLRGQGYEITCGVEGKHKHSDRPRWVYRLVEATPVVVPEPDPVVEPLEQMEIIA
jgi:hypothetical protein